MNMSNHAWTQTSQSRLDACKGLLQTMHKVAELPRFSDTDLPRSSSFKEIQTQCLHMAFHKMKSGDGHNADISREMCIFAGALSCSLVRDNRAQYSSWNVLWTMDYGITANRDVKQKQ